MIDDRIVPAELRRHHKELAEYNELPEAGKAAYDEARISREAAYHHQAMRTATEAAPSPAAAAASARRPALRPPASAGTTTDDQVGGLSNPTGPGISAGGVGR